ncbi:MAG: hypothetical protein JSW03_09890 [Candidatus Eiseniibacteriota bacterium]|nr:MAG: hypothetical protein JSW03_09890 [Candidatus Eisenbacteria bacterium]
MSNRPSCLLGNAALILLAACALLLAVTQSHAIMTRATLPELAAGATGIVRGQVLDVTSRWDSEGKTIFTYVTISVDEWLKGAGPETVTVRVVGGKVGGVGLWVEDTPVFAGGESVVTFLEPSEEELAHDVRGLFQGKFSVEDGRVIEAGLPLGDFVSMVRSIVKMQEKDLLEE